MRQIPVSVQILHADVVVATGLHTMLSACAGLQVCSLSHARSAWPDADVVVADHATGIALARRATRLEAAPAILVVSQLERAWDVRSAIDSGVLGYVLQSAGSDEIVQAVRRLGARGRFVNAALEQRMAESRADDALTSREIDVLRLLAEGHCNKLIARNLGIGVGTVKSHLHNVMVKLGASARTHAVAVATQRGLITPRHWSA